MKHNLVKELELDGVNLNCPSCDSLNTHQHNVRVDGLNIKIDFWCEHCPDINTLVIYQQQGETRVGWYNE